MTAARSNIWLPGGVVWQALFLACACGAWAVHDPLAGGLALAVAAICNLIAGRSTPRVFYFPIAFLLGLAYASLRLPAVPEWPEWPEWSEWSEWSGGSGAVGIGPGAAGAGAGRSGSGARGCGEPQTVQYSSS